METVVNRAKNNVIPQDLLLEQDPECAKLLEKHAQDVRYYAGPVLGFRERPFKAEPLYSTSVYRLPPEYKRPPKQEGLVFYPVVCENGVLLVRKPRGTWSLDIAERQASFSGWVYLKPDGTHIKHAARLLWAVGASGGMYVTDAGYAHSSVRAVRPQFAAFDAAALGC